CALVGDPELLILDEPTSALDPAGRAEMLDMVAAMRGRRTIIFPSHILADVQRIADQVGILRDGRLLYQGSTREPIDTYLQPSWLVRLTGDEPPRLDAGTPVPPEFDAPAGPLQVSCEPAAADLESAFLALTATGAAR